VEVRRRADLAIAHEKESERVVLAAARLGATRLIDNLEF
jgi:pantothenate synthetase